MAFLDQNDVAEFPFKKDDVFEALCRAVPIIVGMSVVSADKLTDRINVKSNISLWSWGESILIQLSSPSADKTKVQITSGSKLGSLGGILDMGKNRKNVERILAGTTAILSQTTTAAATNSNTFSGNSNSSLGKNSVADEIQKLKKLVDEGVLTPEEFAQQKARLLQ